MTDDSDSGSSTPATLGLRVGQASATGSVRTRNEDAVLCEPLEAAHVARRGLLCAVADGMGGHANGEVASALAVQTARDTYYSADADSVDSALRQALETANREVLRAGADASGRDQMGSTMTAAVIAGESVVVGHVGDTRCYLFSNSGIEQLTRDHSWVAEEVAAGALTPEEARGHPRRNIITRALGLDPDVAVDVYRASLAGSAGLVLCSDGLYGVVDDGEILAHVTRLDPQAAVDALVALADERGGPDNISAVVVSRAAARLPSGTAHAPVDEAGERATPTALRPTMSPRRCEVAGQPREVTGRASEVPVAPRRRRRWIVPLVLCLLLALGAGLGWLLYQNSTGPSAPSPFGSLFPRAALASEAIDGAAMKQRVTGPWRGVQPHSMQADEEDVDEESGSQPRALGGAAQLEVEADEALMRAAPVVDAPVASVLSRGARVRGEIEVRAEALDGDPRWYLVTDEGAAPPVRGFVHSPLLRRTD